MSWFWRSRAEEPATVRQDPFTRGLQGVIEAARDGRTQADLHQCMRDYFERKKAFLERLAKVEMRMFGDNRVVTPELASQGNDMLEKLAGGKPVVYAFRPATVTEQIEELSGFVRHIRKRAKEEYKPCPKILRKMEDTIEGELAPLATRAVMLSSAIHAHDQVFGQDARNR